jgi:hypothetical protein
MATAQEYDAKALLLQSQMDYLQADDNKCVEFLRVLLSSDLCRQVHKSFSVLASQRNYAPTLAFGL